MNILVTGASRGIGKTIAKSLQSYGNVYVTARNEEKLKEFGNEMYFVCDLSKEEDLLKLGDFIQEKKIDILVNNAGEYTYCGIEDTEISKLNEMLSINLKAPIYLMHSAIPHMKKNKFGRVINIGSISGVMGEAYASMYSATKAGLIGLSKATGLELAEFGITVNTINPGWVDTELGKSSIEDSEFSEEEILESIPQRRFVKPEEIAGLVKYLISEEAKGITGQSINICAGLSVGI
ncbi:3-hydroxybutyrate dehydrogenase [Clostridium sp. CAG:813]|nr:3-hydroxybutyrate dehydrogenase [Clostridium sp. CAG:813]